MTVQRRQKRLPKGHPSPVARVEPLSRAVMQSPARRFRVAVDASSYVLRTRAAHAAPRLTLPNTSLRHTLASISSHAPTPHHHHQHHVRTRQGSCSCRRIRRRKEEGHTRGRWQRRQGRERTRVKRKRSGRWGGGQPTQTASSSVRRMLSYERFSQSLTLSLVVCCLFAGVCDRHRRRRIRRGGQI
jgi:hypothetical protein